MTAASQPRCTLTIRITVACAAFTSNDHMAYGLGCILETKRLRQQKASCTNTRTLEAQFALSCDTCGIRSTSQIKLANSNAWLQLKSHEEKFR